jgi:hypothetical protein
MAVYTVYGTLALDDPPSPPDAPSTDSANSYLDAKIGAGAWILASEDDRERAMVSAARMLDRLKWKGTKTVANQPLAWPRTGVTLSDGTAVDSTYYPLAVTHASYELAFVLLTNPTAFSQNAQGGSGNIKRLKAGSAEIEYFKSVAFGVLPPEVLGLVSDYLSKPGVGTGTAIISGVTDESIFDDFRSYDIQGT